MPELTGWEVYLELKTSGFAVPVIFMTANSDFSSNQNLSSADNRITLLHKPFTEQQILEAIGRIKAR
jgi:FixJ family two-component response regulator